jgi:hypothetical protein
MAKKSTEYRWKIYRLRGTPAQFVGSVSATDAGGDTSYPQ